MVIRTPQFRWTVLALFLSASSFAQPRATVAGVRLSWVRGEGANDCIGAASLERDVSRRLGYSPFGGEARQWFDGLVTLEPGQYRAQLFERDSDGHTQGKREFTDNTGDCRNLSEAVSLALALIIDPNAPLQPLDSPNLPTTVNSPNTVPQNASSAPSPSPSCSLPSGVLANPKGELATNGVTVNAVDRDAKNQKHRGRVWLIPALRWGLFPEVAPSIELAVEGTLKRDWSLDVRLGMLYFPEVRAKGVVAELGYGLTAGVVGLCLSGHGAFRAFGCLGLEGGALHTVVYNPDPDQPGDRLWVAGRAEVGVEVSIFGPISTQLRLLGAIPVTHWDFFAKENGLRRREYSQAWFEPGVAFGLGMHFL